MNDAEYKDYIRRSRLQAEPTDFAELERKGIIVKDKGGWYRIPDFRLLPDHAIAKIQEFEEGKQRVKFEKGLAKAAAKLLEQELKERPEPL